MLPDEPDLQGQDTSAPVTPATDDLRGDIITAFRADLEGSTADDDGIGTEARGPGPSSEGQARDALGRFTHREPQPPDVASLAARAAADAAAVTARPQDGAQTQQTVASRPAGPPPGWSVQGKAAYDKLPDAVKADIAKREVEVSNGLAKLAEYKGLDPYVQMARNAQTTLPEALARYVNAENALETDPVSGTLWLCQRYNVDPAQLMYGLCQMHGIHPLQLVQALGGDQPLPQDQQGQPRQPGDPRTMQHIQALNERLAYMEQERENYENQTINSQITEFANDPANRFFENVRHHMAHLIRTAPQNVPLTLKDVYDQACWAHPEIREALINERSAGRQTPRPRQRPASIPGAAGSLPPGSPVNGGTFVRNEPANTLREEIERAFDEQRGL